MALVGGSRRPRPDRLRHPRAAVRRLPALGHRHPGRTCPGPAELGVRRGARCRQLHHGRLRHDHTNRPGDLGLGDHRAADHAPPATAPPAPQEGDPVAKIEIPRIGVDWIVVEGVDVADLRKGPGHYPGTALPGVRGNVAIAGHRTTYGAPFQDVNELEPGDEIILTSVTGRYVYRVTEHEDREPVGDQRPGPLRGADPHAHVVPPGVLGPRAHHRDGGVRRRGVVAAAGAVERAACDDHADPGAPATTAPGQVTTVPATTQPDSPVVSPPAPDLDTFGQGWVSDQKAWAQLAPVGHDPDRHRRRSLAPRQAHPAVGGGPHRPRAVHAGAVLLLRQRQPTAAAQPLGHNSRSAKRRPRGVDAAAPVRRLERVTAIE